MKDADVISVKQPIREQQGGKKGGRRGRAQKGVFYVPLQHQCKKKEREEKRHDSVDGKEKIKTEKKKKKKKKKKRKRA